MSNDPGRMGFSVATLGQYSFNGGRWPFWGTNGHLVMIEYFG